LAVLRRDPGVASANPVPRAKVLEMLAPWLGTGASVNDLPLPALIDVQIQPGHGDASAIAAALRKAVPAAVVDDHRVWLSRLTSLAQGVGAIALTLIALVAVALTLTVVFATRASLAEFAQVIEVLHLFGARDDYIAAQFSRRAMSQAVVGGLGGLLIYAPALALIAWLASRVEQGILPDVGLPALHWLVVALLPLIAGAIAMITAHLTVRRKLQAMV
jgi:cell division transport system permease protein